MQQPSLHPCPVADQWPAVYTFFLVLPRERGHQEGTDNKVLFFYFSWVCVCYCRRSKEYNTIDCPEKKVRKDTQRRRSVKKEQE